MGDLVVGTFVTLDGVMQAPGGPEEDTEGGFDKGGWQASFADEPEFLAFMVAQFRAAGAFLLGRKTYDIFANYWPEHADPADPIASRLNTLPKYVASRTLTQDQLTWEGARLLTGDIAEAIRAAREETDGNLVVSGSGNLIQTLLREGLVDEFQLLIYPVVLGKGKRLFEEGLPNTLELVESRTTANGVVILKYRPGAPLTFGTIGE